MKNLHQLNLVEFVQPTAHVYSRTMQGKEEIIQYLPNSHVRIWYNTEPATYEEHFHNCIEIIFILEGDSIADLQTNRIELTTGDILIIPPYMMHSTKSSYQYKQFILQLDVSPLSIFGLFNSPDSTINDILLCNTKECPQIYDSIYNNLIDMIDSYFAYKPFWELDIYSHLLRMISDIGENRLLITTPLKADSHNNTKQQYNKFSELLKFIDENYTEQLTLDMAASHVGFSKYHFIRLFKEYAGTTFYDYLTKKRIQHAKELLYTNIEITDIAFSCGFNNQTSFCRTFKKECGMPPSAYRQYLLNND